MRLRGRRPGCVFIDVGIEGDLWSDWHLTHPERALVQIEPGDMLSSLDVRWCTGMLTLIEGFPAERVKAIEAKCIEVGASRVVTTIQIDGLPVTTDTAGHMGALP